MCLASPSSFLLFACFPPRGVLAFFSPSLLISAAAFSFPPFPLIFRLFNFNAKGERRCLSQSLQRAYSPCALKGAGQLALGSLGNPSNYNTHLRNTIQGWFGGYSSPLPLNTKSSAPGRFCVGKFCWFQEVLFCLGRLQQWGMWTMPPFRPTHPVPEVAAAEQQNELPNKPSGGKAPSHLMLIPS